MKGNLSRAWALWVRGLMLALLSVSLVALFTQSAHAQVVRFAKIYGVTDFGRSVQQTSDGGYIVAGYTEFATSRDDISLIKTDAYGNIQWAKTYDWGTNYNDVAYSVQQTSDGGYIVAGVRSHFVTAARDLLLMKTDANGNVQWAKTYGGPLWDFAHSVQQTSDGGYIAAGGSHVVGVNLWDIFLVKTDANGNLQWAKTYAYYWGNHDDIAHSVQQTSDGGYIVAGVTAGDFFLMKTDANGNVQWAKTYGGTGWDGAYSVQQTSDGGYIVAGYTRSFGAGGADFFVVKTDANGNLEWAKTYGGIDWDYAFSVQQTSDGGYIIAGRTYSFGAGLDDIILIKTDANGNLEWAKTYGGTNNDYATSVQQTSDGGYIVAGGTRSFGANYYDFFLIKTDANGDIGSCGIVRNVTPTVNTVSPTVTTHSPSVSSTSFTVDSPSPTVRSLTHPVTAPCPLSHDNELGISESCQIASGLITLYKGGIKVSGSGEFEVKVYNVSGAMVKSVKGKNEVKLELSRGVYFVEVISGGKVIREKVVIR
ncbi:MAG: T9SS type A sorting domain-containing protein [Candidatus Caldipriscus sp.]